MCIRDRIYCAIALGHPDPAAAVNCLRSDREPVEGFAEFRGCLLYTSDAADDLLCVDLGGRRIIKKNNRATAMLDISDTTP